jgi:tRNA A37 N6-isopentenylltransferase MiaA
MSAADWAELARAEIAEIHAGGRLPILVGGTGLYIRTLLDGIAPVPPIDPVIRSEVRAAAVADNLKRLRGIATFDGRAPSTGFVWNPQRPLRKEMQCQQP